jgi:hypothetical protein
MSDLKPALERIRDGFVPPEGALDRFLTRRTRRRRNQRVAAAVLALVLSGAAASGLWSVLRVAPRPASQTGMLPGEAVDVAVGDGWVWVLTCDRRCGNDGRASEGSLVRIDLVTKKVVDSASVARPHALAVGEGAVWVVDFWGGRVTRFDPRTLNPVASIQLRLPFDVCENDCSDARDFAPFDVAAGEGAAWVTTARGVLARIDPATNTVARMVRVPGEATGEVAAGEGAVWVTESVLGLFRIDPSTNRVVAKIKVDGADNRRLAIDQVSTGGGSVWVEGTWAQGSDQTGYVVSEGAALVRLDPSTGRVRAQIPLQASGRAAVGDGVAWISGAGESLAALDDAGRAIGKPVAGAGGILAPEGKAVWVANGHRFWKALLCPTGPCIEGEPTVTPSPSPSSTVNQGEPRLFLAGDGEMWVVDVGTGSVRHLQLSELSPGDPPYRIARREDRLVLWGSTATYVLDPNADAALRVLVEGSLVFMPSAAADRVWVAVDSTDTGNVGALREVSVDGQITVPDTKPPGGRWPVAAVEEGLVFQVDDDTLEVWDPRSGEVIRRLPGLFPLAWEGHRLAWCDAPCEEAHITDFSSGMDQMIPLPPGIFHFEGYEGAFSPDGGRLALIGLTDRRVTEAGRQLVLVDAETGASRAVPGTVVQFPYNFVDWSPSGTSVFITGGEGFQQRQVVEYRPQEGIVRVLPVRVGNFYGMAVA